MIPNLLLTIDVLSDGFLYPLWRAGHSQFTAHQCNLTHSKNGVNRRFVDQQAALPVENETEETSHKQGETSSSAGKTAKELRVYLSLLQAFLEV